MKKYYVIAKRWNFEKSEVEEYIAGEFTNFVNAQIFKIAYNERYSSIAEIKEMNI